MAALTGLLNNYTFWVVAAGSAVLGLMSGLVGTFTVLRKQSLLGDAVSHSAMPGIALIFLILQQKSTEIFMIGAVASGLFAAYLISKIVKNSKIDYGTSLALVMSAMFGLGMVLLTVIQRQPNSNQAGIERFIFGQASTMLMRDVIVLLIVSAVIIAVTLLMWKEFKLISFDAEYAKCVGFSTGRIGAILTMLTVLTIIVGLQTVGVVLMSALLIAPAVAARQWTDKLWVMAVLSAIIGGFSGVTGTLVGAVMTKIPTGPAIVVVVSMVVLLSLLTAPKRGLIWSAIRRWRNRAEYGKNKTKGDRVV